MKSAGTCFLLALGLGVALCLAQTSEKTAILRPADKSILNQGQFSIIAQASGGGLRLDGKPLSSIQPAPGVLTIKVMPSPGLHELVLTTQEGEQKLQFFVQATAHSGRTPEGWKTFKVHPPEASCDTCHALKEGIWSFKGSVLSENCFGCHDQKTFPEGHTHNEEVLAECQLCHDPHGSTEKYLLTMPRETACKQCHG